MAIVNTNKLEVTKLDFHGIRDSLKTFLQGQSEFNDYDFDGSGLGSILDLLSYNTHYLAFYLNMVANEMFLDSATQRSSVVGIARGLGYTPKSARGALASVNFTLTTGSGASTITLPKWTPFSVVVDKDKFLFYTLADKTVATVSNTSAFSNIPIKEGVLVDKSWTYNTEGKKQRFILDNPYIDTTTLSVTVKPSKTTGTATTYTLYKNLEGLDSTSEVYFLQEVEDGRYEVYFGDGIYGKQLAAENIISVQYLTTNGSRANYAGRNDIERFKLLTSINDSNAQSTTASSVTISVNGYATSGTLPESVSSIKFNAPLSFAAQDRAVTANDYKNILLTNYGNIRAVKVWGGKPQIGMKFSGLQERSGSVYICILPKHGTFLPAVTKNYILKSILAPYKVIGMRNEIIDPNFIKLLSSVEIIYNPTVTEIPAAALEKKILKSVKKYAMSDLEVFDGKYRHSVLQSVLNDADPSIVSVTNLVTRFRSESKFDFSNVQTIEPSFHGTGRGIATLDWKRVVFNPVSFGMSIQPSSIGNGLRTNTFFVWAESLPNYGTQPPAGGGEYLKQNLWMKGAKLFAWSMKKADAVGDSTSNTDITNEVHAGNFIECYFKDDGEGRLNLYATGENGDIRIPFASKEGEYKDSPDFSWIETQANKFGFQFLRDKTVDPTMRLAYMTDSATGELKATADPDLLDYESWGSVNYHLGKIGKMKPIAILGMASDIVAFADGVTPLSIGQHSMWFGESVYTSIKLSQKIQTLNWDAHQYIDEDGGNLGGYTASGNTVMIFDSNYLTTNIKLRTTSDRPSLQIGTRSATEEVQKALPPSTKGKETTSKKLQEPQETQAVLEAVKHHTVGPAVHHSIGLATGSSDIITEESEAEEHITSPTQNIVIEIDESIDPIKTAVTPSVSSYAVSQLDAIGNLWQISSLSRDLTNYLAQLVELEGGAGAQRHANSNASTGTWEVRLVKKAVVKEPEIITPKANTKIVVDTPKPDVKQVVTIGPAWDSGELIGPASGGSTSSNCGGSGTTTPTVTKLGYNEPTYNAWKGDDMLGRNDYIADGTMVPDEVNTTPITPATPTPTEVIISVEAMEPTDSEKQTASTCCGTYHNPKTNTWEKDSTLQLGTGNVFDPNLSISTVTDTCEVDYATTSCASGAGWSDLSSSCEAYSAAGASTFDTYMSSSDYSAAVALPEDNYYGDSNYSAGSTYMSTSNYSATTLPEDNYYGSSSYTASSDTSMSMSDYYAGTETSMNNSSCDSQEFYSTSIC